MGKAKSERIAVVGVGMVGATAKRYFEEKKGYVRGRDLFLFDTDPKKGYSDDPNQADIVFVAVPTPNGNSGSADTSSIHTVLAGLSAGKTVVIRSTVPPGTTERLQKTFPHLNVLFNPEFLTEKRAWEDFLHPDRQLVGFTEQSRDIAAHVLALLPPAPLMSPSKTHQLIATEAELVKYAGNVYLARRVVFANAIADIAEALGANYENVRDGLAADMRIGGSHLDVQTGGYRGFGGYCFPKDMKALIATCNELGLSHCAELLEADWNFNADLLRKQGLMVEDVAVHDAEWDKKAKKA